MRFFHVLLIILLLPIAIDAQEFTPINSPKGTTYALIVGISSYQYLTPLKYADRDAVLFKDFLTSKAGGNVKEENILFLVNDDAKGGTLNTRALGWIENRKFNQGDRMIIYLAGHGDAIDEDEYFFLGSDLSTGNDGAKNNYTAGFTLQMYNIKARIKRLTAKGVQVILIMDACRSNELAGGEAGQKIFANGVINNHAGGIMMMSAGAGQSAIENSAIGGGHGLFTWYLIAGLSGEADKNNDGKIDLYELSNYVKDNTRNDAYSKFKGHKQSPEFSGYTDDSRIIAYVDTEFHKKWLTENSLAKSISNTDLVAVNKSRSVTSPSIDSLLISQYNMFMLAIKQNRVLGDNCAETYLDNMMKLDSTATLTEDAKYTLAGEYLNFAQGKINLLLSDKIHYTSIPSYVQINKLINEKNNKVRESIKYKNDVISILPYNDLVEMMHKAMILMKSDTLLINQLLPKYKFLLASSSLQSNSTILYKFAIDIIKDALKAQPNAAYLYLSLGTIYTFEYKDDSAENAFKTALKVEPLWSLPLKSLAILYSCGKKYNQSLEIFLSLIKTDSLNSYNYANMSNTYGILGDSINFKKYFYKAISIDSTSPYMFNMFGTNYFESFKLSDSGEKYLLKAIELDSLNPSAYMELGYIYTEKKMYKEAETLFLKTITLDSTNAPAYFNLACNKGIENDIPSLLIYLEKAFKFGYKNYDELVNTKEFLVVKNDKRYKSLLKKYFPDKYKE